MKLHYQLTN